MLNPINAVQNFRVTVSSGSQHHMMPAAVSIPDRIGGLLGVGNSDVIDADSPDVQGRPVLDNGISTAPMHVAHEGWTAFGVPT